MSLSNDKRAFGMDFLLKIMLWIIFAALLFVALNSILKRFGIWR